MTSAQHPARSPWTRGPVTLHTGDASRILTTMPDASVDCIVTSPPYWGLRDYGTGHWAGGHTDCAHDGAPPHGGPTSNDAARPATRCGSAATPPARDAIRRYVGIELNPEYNRLARSRLAPYLHGGEANDACPRP
jgi:DNA modification methylase